MSANYVSSPMPGSLWALWHNIPKISPGKQHQCSYLPRKTQPGWLKSLSKLAEPGFEPQSGQGWSPGDHHIVKPLCTERNKGGCTRAGESQGRYLSPCSFRIRTLIFTTCSWFWNSVLWKHHLEPDLLIVKYFWGLRRINRQFSVVASDPSLLLKCLNKGGGIARS